jgi:hypothetical protein
MKLAQQTALPVDHELLRTAIVQTLGEEALRYVARI